MADLDGIERTLSERSHDPWQRVSELEGVAEQLIAELREARSQRDLAMHWGFDAIDELGVADYCLRETTRLNDVATQRADRIAALEAELAQLRAEPGPGRGWDPTV